MLKKTNFPGRKFYGTLNPSSLTSNAQRLHAADHSDHQEHTFVFFSRVIKAASMLRSRAACKHEKKHPPVVSLINFTSQEHPNLRWQLAYFVGIVGIAS
jgi:hypothetical protein